MGKRLATTNHSCAFRTNFWFLHANAPMRAGSRSRRHWFGSSLEGRIKMISNSDHAFESGHATPLEAQTHFGRNARQRRNSDVTNLVIVGRSAAGSRLLASRFYGYLAAIRRASSSVKVLGRSCKSSRAVTFPIGAA